MTLPRTLTQIGDVRRAALDLGTQSCGLARAADGWHPGYPCCDGRLPFNTHTVETLAAMGLMAVTGDAATTTRAGREALRELDSAGYREAAE